MCLGEIGDKPCVLIVDDRADNREVLSAAFLMGGFCVSEARTAGEVVHSLNEHCEAGDSCFDVIIMDIDLPDVRGTTLGKWIHARYPNVVIRYLTAYPAPIFYEEAKRQGAKVTQKPLPDISEFVAEIYQAVKDSTFAGDRRKRGSVNHSGEHRRVGDIPIVLSQPLAEHIAAVASARKGV
jgi:DNA-binding NtrC family response regulator